MKKICLILCLFLLFTLCGCSADNPYVQAWNEGVEKGQAVSKEEKTEVDRRLESRGRYFEIVADDTYYGISYYRDIRTDVMYVLYWRKAGYGAGAAISVMLDVNGLPMTYEKWKQLGELVDG